MRGWHGLGKAQIATLIALFALVAAVISTTTDVIGVGWFGNAQASHTPSTPATPASTPATPAPTTTSPTVSGQAVELSAESAGSRKVTVTAELRRPARAGYVYWFVLEVHQVSGTHSEYYPRQRLTQSGAFTLSIPEDADASRPRSGTVFEVTEEASQRFESNRPDQANPSADFLLAPPCRCAVSDEVKLPF